MSELMDDLQQAQALAFHHWRPAVANGWRLPALSSKEGLAESPASVFSGFAGGRLFHVRDHAIAVVRHEEELAEDLHAEH
jgi:hypothetical protein